MTDPKAEEIKVLVVDDSAFVRSAVSQIIDSDPLLKVVGMAGDGQEAVEKVQELKPQIVTLDINMPVMNGLDALEAIKKVRPEVQVLMISSLTEEGAHATFEALQRGAVDFIPKSLGDSAFSLLKIREEILRKIRGLAGQVQLEIPVKEYVLPREAPVAPPREVNLQDIKAVGVEVLGIGVSTGGPRALQEVIPILPEKMNVPGVVVIHMPKEFIPPFAERLDSQSKVSVMVAENGQSLVPGQILVAPGKTHLKLVRKKGRPHATVVLDPEPSDSLHRPSVDQTFISMAGAYPGKALGVIMTGMGQDGLLGAREMKKNKNFIFAQDRESCVVYGMPKAVVESHLVDKILPLSQLGIYISQVTAG